MLGTYVFGVAVLFLFSIIAPASTNQIGTNLLGGGLFRSFEDENMPLFDKVTSVGYGFLDRSSELYNLVQSPQCSRYMMCHLSSTLGDQEANGFLFKDLLRYPFSFHSLNCSTNGTVMLSQSKIGSFTASDRFELYRIDRFGSIRSYTPGSNESVTVFFFFFVYFLLSRSISATLDNKGGTEGMTRSVNVGLLTGDCDEPQMNCPELAPYFKKVAETWSNYL